MNFEKWNPDIPEKEGEIPTEEKSVAVESETAPKQEVATKPEQLEQKAPSSPEKQPEKIESPAEKPESSNKPEYKPENNVPMGDFDGADLDGKKIKVSVETREYIEGLIPSFKTDPVSKPNSVMRAFAGYKTATEYEGKANTMSTITKIVELPDGKKAFAVYNYPTSRIHRSIDKTVRKLYGNPLKKAESEEWKGVFESRSGIPTIENSDPNVIVMPYIPNVNAYDLFTLNHEIKDFGPHDWAAKAGLDEKIVIGKKIIAALEEKHIAGISWGEVILNNIIIQPDGTPVIVDPETQYNDGVPFDEQKARDLQEIVISICAGLNGGEGVEDFQSVVRELLGEYKDPAIIEKLKGLVDKKPTISQRIIQPLYNTFWRRINKKNFNSVRRAISNTR